MLSAELRKAPRERGFFIASSASLCLAPSPLEWRRDGMKGSLFCKEAQVTLR